MSEYTDRPKFSEYKRNDSIPEEYDIVQLKMDGIWGCMVVGEGQWTLYSRTGKVKAEGEIENPNIDCVLLGEYMHGSHWGHKMGVDGEYFVFDCIEIHGQDLKDNPLADRLDIARDQVSMLKTQLDFINDLETYEAKEDNILWDNYVKAQSYEGLVYKNSSSKYFDKNAWARVKGVVEVEYICRDFRPADEGTKYEGQVGAVIGTLADKEVLVTCGGLSDADRLEYTENGDDYIGKVFTAKGNAWYPSGSIRHPKFKEWRDDKQPIDCTYDQIPESLR
jgi:ATP-dependent DNA ligase